MNADRLFWWLQWFKARNGFYPCALKMEHDAMWSIIKSAIPMAACNGGPFYFYGIKVTRR